jgi:hypothetical protein
LAAVTVDPVVPGIGFVAEDQTERPAAAATLCGNFDV